jgi:hypothetical protein
MRIQFLLPAAAFAAIGAAVLIAGAQPAAAYSCAISPHGDAVIIKTDNTDGAPKICTVTCRYVTATFTCTQSIPGGAKGWFVCLRPSGGKVLGALQGGGETCR